MLPHVSSPMLWLALPSWELWVINYLFYGNHFLIYWSYHTPDFLLIYYILKHWSNLSPNLVANQGTHSKKGVVLLRAPLAVRWEGWAHAEHPSGSSGHLLPCCCLTPCITSRLQPWSLLWHVSLSGPWLTLALRDISSHSGYKDLCHAGVEFSTARNYS